MRALRQVAFAARASPAAAAVRAGAPSAKRYTSAGAPASILSVRPRAHALHRSPVPRRASTSVAELMDAEPSPSAADPDWALMPDGTPLYTRTWNSRLEPPRATVLFVHGLGEHIGRYERMFEAFSASGITVYGYDQRGSGRTGRRFECGAVLGHSEGMSRTLEDMDNMLRRTKTGNLPQFLMGQSMGGCAVLNYAARGMNRHDLSGVIATSPFLDFGMPQPWLKVTALSAVAKLLPSFVIHTRLPSVHISRNTEVNRNYDKDCLVHDLASLQTISEALFTGRALVNAEYKDIKVPLYLAHGTGDQITSYPATKKFYENVKSATDATLDTYEGAYHELYNEPPPGGEQCVRTIINWILNTAQTHDELSAGAM